MRQLLNDYANQQDDQILSTKLDSLIQLSNPNDTRIMAFDILKNIFDDGNFYVDYF